MTAVCFYFKVHQPCRLHGEWGNDTRSPNEVDDSTQKHVDRLSDECYLPTNNILMRLIDETGGLFKISFSISGTAIELLLKYRPDVIESFRQLVYTGCVEILAETYNHSLASLHSRKEWQKQIELHASAIENIFSVKPVVYRNTELIHDNNIASFITDMGFKGILCEGVERILQGRDVNRLYTAPTGIPLLLRNANLSDDIAFRFDDPEWSERPLTAEKFAGWLHGHPKNTEMINLFMDYETFGIHKKKDTGIFDFLEKLPSVILKNETFSLALPNEMIRLCKPVGVYDVTHTISWEDKASASCVWSENMMQHNMLRKIYSLENMVMDSGDVSRIARWRALQAADHFYYMTNDNNKYHNPFPSEKDAYEKYVDAVNSFEVELIRGRLEHVKNLVKPKQVLFNLL